MGLYEMVQTDGEIGSPVKLPVHPFYSAMRSYLRDNQPTRQQIIDAFLLAGEPDAVRELDAIKTTYDGLRADQQNEYMERIHETWTLAEWVVGNTAAARLLQDKTRARAKLGF